MPNCPICKASRWKDPKKTKGKKVANKIVRYFPLTPRLQRMFNTKHIAKWMTWHATRQSKENGKMNHPCDDKALEISDMMKPSFLMVTLKTIDLRMAADEQQIQRHDKASKTLETLEFAKDPEVDTDILAYREDSPDNVETSFPAWFNYKVVEHVYHRDVAESDQDVIHGSSSSHVTLSVGLTCLEHTYLSINAQSTEVYRPTINDDNANANEDKLIFYLIMKIDSFAHVPVYDDDVMACVAPRSHGGDAGGVLPRRPNRPVRCCVLRRTCVHKEGDVSKITNQPCSLALITPILSYFNLAEWYNNQDKVVVGSNVYTVGERVRLGLELKLRLLWRKNKNRIKADHYTKHDSPDEAKNHPPPPRVWGDRTQDEWNELVDWWSHPNRVSRSLQNAANRAKNTILTHQGKKSFAQGRNEYKVEKGHYEDLIETWRKGHSSKKTGEFKTEQNKQRYLDMKAMQEMIKAGIIPFKTDQEILDEVMTQILRQQEQEKELYRKQAEEAQQRAYLASLKADQADQRANVAYQNTESIYGALAQRPHYTLLTNPHMNDSRSCDQLAQDLAREKNNECSSREGEEEEEEEGEQQSGDDYLSEEEE
ncbi:acidic leucine-rich nuclear phosphoprotein 32 family member A [Tanacetum coccineum]